MKLTMRVLIAVLAVFALASCSSGSDYSGGIADDAAPAPELDEAEADSGDDAGGGPGESPSEDRMVITTAEAELIADDPAITIDDIARQAEALGGHVEARDQWADDDGRVDSASITVRAPAEDFGDLTDGLDDLGELVYFTQSAVDVTGTARDLDARITAAQTSVDRLLDIMTEADNTSDLITIETTLSERQAQLERLQAERNRLGDQVSLSTLSVHVTSEPSAEVQADGFLGGLQSGWAALIGFVNGALVAVGALLPFVVALGVPVLLLVALLRRRSRRRRAELAVGPAGYAAPGGAPAAPVAAPTGPVPPGGAPDEGPTRDGAAPGPAEQHHTPD
ncbi:DUF4349 domain-containing protein [Bogoriella caseilytica]|uniref:Uncharacterized protein DUF4349 n=1 Tax=Bogoriella caseilytica TaxID=56055 RepID=A0A3N2BB14_9MICO|nr:DUF4349 domain-containing protein [Bogoriella caseilytica]ROR72453.1 uncharacterized protein DUF4349 [Bogoriella caseilytica]